MIFDLKLGVRVFSNPISHKGELVMGNWAERAATKLKEQEDKERVNTELASRREGRVHSEAPYLWDELKGELERNVREFSTLRPNFLSINPLIQGLTTVKLQSSNGRELHITFDGSVPILTCTLYQMISAYKQPSKSEGKIAFRSDQGATGTWFYLEEDQQHSASTLAEYFLNMLIE